MRRFDALILVLVGIITLAAVWLFTRGIGVNAYQLQLTSNPFPLVVGQNTLQVSLLDGSGSAVDGATVSVTANRAMPGQLPINGRTTRSENGVYSIPLIWSAVDRWTIDVTAQLPNSDQVIRDQFLVFAYPIQQQNKGEIDAYRSLNGIARTQAENPEEFWIVIPPGTEALIREGHGDDVMPAEIRLFVDGQNTLVIQNNDIGDHTIGPFFVGAGETLRQRFTQPAVYQGVCSVRHDSIVSIIIEGEATPEPQDT